jgi:hypothetical protein
LAPRVEEICAQAYRDKARDELKAIREQIKKDGTRPESKWPSGETLYDTATGYGHGEAIVVGEEGIWAVDHNGADGDNWSYNNLPGCIGWRIDFNAELAETLKFLVTKAQLKK